jgi:hypothetical protein
MKSNKQHRKEIKLKRLARAKKLKKELDGTMPPYAMGDPESQRKAGIVFADPNELKHNNTYGILPTYYLDKPFTCVDCGSEEAWTAKQQKWWYEIAKGNINSTAIRCRPCRNIKQELKAEARRIHLEGIARKKNSD